jgi:hypothetical protein
VRTIKEIAVRENSDERYVARIIKLAFFAPDITVAILDDKKKTLARKPAIKELDFYGEGSVHADVVGGLEGIAPTAAIAPRLGAGLWVVGAPRMRRGCPSGGPPDGQI